MTEGKTKNRQELTAYLADTYDTSLIDSFREQPGIFPGWHMNKAHWLSAALDGTGWHCGGRVNLFSGGYELCIDKKVRKWITTSSFLLFQICFDFFPIVQLLA